MLKNEKLSFVIFLLSGVIFLTLIIKIIFIGLDTTSLAVSPIIPNTTVYINGIEAKNGCSDPRFGINQINALGNSGLTLYVTSNGGLRISEVKPKFSLAVEPQYNRAFGPIDLIYNDISIGLCSDKTGKVIERGQDSPINYVQAKRGYELAVPGDWGITVQQADEQKHVVNFSNETEDRWLKIETTREESEQSMLKPTGADNNFTFGRDDGQSGYIFDYKEEDAEDITIIYLKANGKFHKISSNIADRSELKSLLWAFELIN